MRMVEPALNRCLFGDCRELLRALPDESFQCCVTSPPYWGLRDYGHPDQLGHEETPEEYVESLVGVFSDVRRTLRGDGTLWLNLGDSYAGAPGGYQGKNGQRASRTFTARIDHAKRGPGLKPKDLVGIPWRVAFALQADGWWLRSDIIWHKPNPMPESVSDRPTKAHEYLFLLTKSERYFYDADAIREGISESTIRRFGADPYVKRRPDGEPTHAQLSGENTCGVHPAGRNARSVWTIPSEPYDGAHFATMPTHLVQRCIQAGSKSGDAVLDPFFGSGTVGQVAEGLGRSWLGCELNEKYAPLIGERTKQVGIAFGVAK